MTDKERYAVQIALVKEECKDVDEDEVAKEFEKYENEEMVSYNGVSFDGAASLEQLLTNRAYKENQETNKTWQKIGKKFTDGV